MTAATSRVRPWTRRFRHGWAIEAGLGVGVYVLFDELQLKSGKKTAKTRVASTAEDVLEELLGPLGVPVLFGLPIGHGKHHATVPLGAMATLDGQVGVALMQGDVVVLKTSEHRTRLIRFPESSYYHVLREKLKWGDG